ncbi:hypothetical protein KM917_14100 [Virgibacillus pantothenticus]|uniref:hypothetical protein n=1 Tax=Virgibacillus pantothenticus TaxID=1473 RepID=UPI001C24D330|nr:hypothetical protein [Virgibacillus pantothenticus]MBU8669639.1 hypothetical protein [Virgibacillus pantothenticus]MEB5458331.1 hypothetical protein [Virgibacillus pantothenticus]
MYDKRKEGRLNLLKVLKTSLAIIIMTDAIYMLRTDNFEFISYYTLLLSVFILVTGADECKEGRKGMGT